MPAPPRAGGTVYLGRGPTFPEPSSSTIVLRGNVTFQLEAGATLLGSTDPGDYPPQPGPSPRADANTRHLPFGNARGAC